MLIWAQSSAKSSDDGSEYWAHGDSVLVTMELVSSWLVGVVSWLEIVSWLVGGISWLDVGRSLLAVCGKADVLALLRLAGLTGGVSETAGLTVDGSGSVIDTVSVE